MEIFPNDIIVFFGDSVTDTFRVREDPNDLGHGYSYIAAAELGAKYPKMNLKFYNRGNSGDKIDDLNQRLYKDVLSLKPTVISILIGVNDTWHNIDSPESGTKVFNQVFESKYRKLLTDIKENGVNRIILMEPFILPFPEDRKTWRNDLDQKIQIVRHLAKEFNTDFVALDGPINAAGIQNEFDIYAADGVHPTALGYGLIFSEWIKHVEIMNP